MCVTYYHTLSFDMLHRKYMACSMTSLWRTLVSIMVRTWGSTGMRATCKARGGRENKGLH